MLTWIALGLFAALLGALLSVSIRIQINLQGRGEPTGQWALAGGVQTGPVVWSGVAAAGVGVRSHLHVFGRELQLLRKAKKKREPRADDQTRDFATFASAQKRYARVARWFDPLDLLLFLVRERRRIQFGLFELSLDYSFEDVALTGKIQGAVYVLGSIFQDRVRIMQVVSWQSEDRAQALLSGEIRLWPGRALLDTALFMIRHVKLRDASRAKKLEGTPR